MLDPIRQRAGLREHLAGDELFVYDAGGEQLTVLNKTALVIWSLCDGRHAQDEIERLLAEIYPEIERDALASDVQATLRSFRKKGLVE